MARTARIAPFAALALAAGTFGFTSLAGSAGATTTSVAYNCNVPIVGTISGSVNVSASSPAVVPLKSKVSLTGVQVSLTIPASYVNDLISYGITKVSGKATKADITATDAKVATVNAAKHAVTIGPYTLVENQPLTVTVPAEPRTVGTWAPAAAGTMQFSAGTVALSARGYSVSCSPAGSSVLTSTTVS